MKTLKSGYVALPNKKTKKNQHAKHNVRHAFLAIKQQIKKNINAFKTFRGEDYHNMTSLIETYQPYIESCSIVDIHPNYTLEIVRMCSKEILRTNSIIELLKNTLEYAKRGRQPLPYMRVFLYISDVYAYNHQSLPFFVIAKPTNKNGILIPDDTFYRHIMSRNKHGGWETILKQCKQNAIPLSQRDPHIFFRGQNTDKNRQNIRQNMFDYAAENAETSPFKIILKGVEPICNFTKYKYLLNLPGNQPWSYRFKYLFLMGGLVINVDVRQKYADSNVENGKWVNFFDCIFQENRDYINHVYHWDEKDTKEIESNKFQKLVSQLEKTYKEMETSPKKYIKISKQGGETAHIINDKFIYRSMYELLKTYGEVIMPNMPVTSSTVKNR